MVLDKRGALSRTQIVHKRAGGLTDPNRNVWSAALSQAKNEGYRVGLRKFIRPSLEHKAPDLDRMRCADLDLRLPDSPARPAGERAPAPWV